MTEYRNDVPGDWAIDPLRLGVIGTGNAVGDDNPLSWQADALCTQTDPEAFSPRRAVPPGTQKGFARNAR